MHSDARGLLIAIEGADGAGTTTQCRRLLAWLEANGRPAHLTREPSTGVVGRLIRSVLAGEQGEFDATALALLFAADRLDHLRREIEPALAEGRVVLTDRYLLSSLVYQSIAVERGFVAEINRHAPAPDLTLLVDVPAEVAAARRAIRGGPAELFETERAQREVIARYRDEAALLARAGSPITVIDGTPDADTVFAALQKVLAPACGLAAWERAS